jgi:hypothetical protein
LITGTGAQVMMQSASGEVLQFTERQTVKLSDLLSGANDVMDISEHAVNPAVIHHVLAALELNETLIDFSPPLASVLMEDESAFVSIAHRSVTEQTLDANHPADALNIHDVLVSGDGHTAMQAHDISITQVADLMTAGSIEISLPGGSIKDLLND